MEYLQGGRNNIARLDNAVHRPTGFWSKSVHELLNHLKEEGFDSAPEPLGFDEDGNEIVTFLSGDVSNYPLTKAASSSEALTTAAELLRAYHDATVSFIKKGIDQHSWLLPKREPTEVICHGDYAPYNVVLHGNRAVAIIDFDTAHPAPRVWDIAYALYRWAPLKNPNNPDTLGCIETQTQRARHFCDAYRLPDAERIGLVDVVIERLQTLVDFMRTEAKNGNEAFQANLDDGHHLAYLDDIDYLNKNRLFIETGLRQ